MTRPGRLLVAAFLLGGTGVLAFWLRATGMEPIATTADALNALGRVTALLGTYLLLWQLVLMARVPLLERALGMERLAAVHRWNAYAVVGLLGVHAVAQTVGYAATLGLGFLAQTGDFIAHYDGVLDAIVAFALLLLVTVLSVGVVRGRLAYETWFFVHLYAYLAVFLAFGHQLATGSDFLANAPFVVYWCALYLVAGAVVIVYRVAAPIRLFLRHRFRVEKIEREARGALSVYIGGRDLAAFAYQPGQFAIWRFLDGRRWWEAHPFTLSLLPSGKRLRLTVKQSGDFTTALEALRPGTPVLVEGPFGHFTRPAGSGRKALLIAGGIGVTPIRVLAEDMAAAALDVHLLYRCRRNGDVALRSELDALAARHHMRVEYLLSDRPYRGRDAGEWLEARNLVTLVPDIREREVYVCGPAGLTASVLRALRTLGVDEARIHREAFRF